MQLKSIALATLLGLSAVTASAITLQPYEVAKGTKTFATVPAPDGSFSDVYYVDFGAGFDDSPYADIGFAFTELRLKNVVDIEFGQISFTTMAGADIIAPLVPVPGTGPADSASAEFIHQTAPFWMTIKGTVVGTGPTKGSYSFEMVAAPVPEPEAYVLVASGLALVGWVASRRRVSDNV